MAVIKTLLLLSKKSVQNHELAPIASLHCKAIPFPCPTAGTQRCTGKSDGRGGTYYGLAVGPSDSAVRLRFLPGIASTSSHVAVCGTAGASVLCAAVSLLMYEYRSKVSRPDFCNERKAVKNTPMQAAPQPIR